MSDTNIKNLLQNLTESFAHHTAVKKVFGEPVGLHGKTIITVAKVAQGFGGGFGSGYGKKPETSADSPTADNPAAGGEGGGMGGGMKITPVGFIEITENSTRFVRFGSYRLLAIGAVAGLAAGLFWKNSWLPVNEKQKQLANGKDKKAKKKKK